MPRQRYLVMDGLQLLELNAQQRQVLDHIDVLINGKFEQDKADPSLLWRGSSNQFIHRLAASRA